MTRDAYGTGSVYQRASDGRWVGTLQAGWTTRGTRRRVTVYGRTRKAAETKLKLKARDLATTGHPTTDGAGRATVKTFAERWLTQTVRELRPASYATDAGAVKNWIVPTIGHKRFDDLRPSDVRAVDQAQRDAGRAGSTAVRTRSTLTKLLKAAVQEGHTVRPAVLGVKRPTASKGDRDALAVAGALAVLEQATRLPHGSRWVAALMQGMRQGECLGLTWECVALDSPVPTIDVSWQLRPLPYLDKHDRTLGFRVPDEYEARQLEGRLHLVRPKSENSQRIIPLVPWMATALAAWRDVAPASPHDLVWPAVDGGPADTKEDLEEWKALQFAAGWADPEHTRPAVLHPAGRWYGTHEARHTTATLLLEAGIDPEVIKAILGHSSIVTSRLYMHVNQTLTRDAMEKVAKRLMLE